MLKQCFGTITKCISKNKTLSHSVTIYSFGINEQTNFYLPTQLSSLSIGLDKQFLFSDVIVNIFLPIIFSICSVCSCEYPQHMFWLRNKNIIFNQMPATWVDKKFIIQCNLFHNGDLHHTLAQAEVEHSSAISYDAGTYQMCRTIFSFNPY